MSLIDFEQIKQTVLFHEKTKKTSKTKKEKTKKEKVILGKRFEKCCDVVGPIEMGEHIQYVTAGDWSMHDLLLHLINQTGPVEVYAASWSMTENPCRILIKAINDGKIKKLNLLLDWRIKIRCQEAYFLAKQNAANLYLASCHAKTTVIINSQYKIAIVGSQNYTNNPRIEAGVICCSEKAANFHKNWIMAEIKKSNPFETEKANGIKRRSIAKN